MADLVLINGCGGAGKDTTGQLLLGRLERAALLDIKALIKVEPWEFGGEVARLGIRNAASLIANFDAAKYDQIIFTGGVETQEKLELLLSLIPQTVRVYYFWLDVPKSVRDPRRVERQRDEGDKSQYLDQIDRVFTDPGPLSVAGGKYFRIDAAPLTREQVVDEIIIKAGIAQ